MTNRWNLAGSLAVVLTLAGPAAGQDVERQLRELRERVEILEVRLAREDTADVAELRRRIQALTRELERLRLGEDVVVRADSSVYGLGPAASKVYRVGDGVSIGGYGEVLYERFAAEAEDGTPAAAPDQLDALRAIVYVGHKFNDRLLFNSELEFEHGSTGQAGSVSVEFAYLDLLLTDALGIRGGLLLVPMGFLNELHEPPVFLGTTRPETERRIIPSTWRENGVGIFGSAGGFNYRAYLVNGLDAVGGASSDADGFSASGLRGGRQKGSKAVAEDFAGVARLDWEGVPGLTVGASAYYGESGQNRTTLAGDELRVGTLIYEGHLGYRAHGLDLRGLFAVAALDQADELNDVLGLTGAAGVADQLVGAYVHLGYDLLRYTRLTDQLIPYLRYEWLDTQRRVAEGFVRDPANARTVLAAGAAWKPIPNVVVKADYQIHANDAETGVDRLNVALGYLF